VETGQLPWAQNIDHRQEMPSNYKKEALNIVNVKLATNSEGNEKAKPFIYSLVRNYKYHEMSCNSFVSWF
jgi:hypothetical protein